MHCICRPATVGLALALLSFGAACRTTPDFKLSEHPPAAAASDSQAALQPTPTAQQQQAASPAPQAVE
ncbi:MAG TPA: hypothetical protein VHC19_29195, partial [Pirellulales bacterium]|nr:hypothetical protein [Pirellulales bacterium]